MPEIGVDALDQLRGLMLDLERRAAADLEKKGPAAASSRERARREAAGNGALAPDPRS